MHKRNIHRDTDCLRRAARASQARFEEFCDKIEREKHKIIRSSHHEKNKVLNELKSIHRVFKPRLDVISENQNDTLQIAENAVGDEYKTDLNQPVEQPRSLGRAETRATRRSDTEPNMWRPCAAGYRMPALGQNHSRDESGYPAPYAHQRSYRLGQSQNIEAGVPRLSVQKEREYLARLRNAAGKPCVSDSMSSVSMGYLAFKRALKNKRQMERLDRRFVDTRFRPIFLDAAELSVIPEQMVWMNGSVNTHLVKKDYSQNHYSNGRLPTPIRKHCASSSLSSPMADLQMISWSKAKGRNLLSPHLLCARGTDTLCSEMPANQRSGLKEERSKASEATGNYTRECSGISKRSEDLFAKFDKSFREKLMPLSNNKNTEFRSHSSKLLRPLGTGCFSKSFKAVSQIEK